MATPGRKRKSRVVRYPKSGRITRKSRRQLGAETERETRQVALAGRAKHTGLKAEQAADPMAATPYGILYLLGELRMAQRDAATAYQEIVTRAYALKGLPIPHVHSAAAAWISLSGPGATAEPDDDAVGKAWARYHTVLDALMTAGRETGTSRGVPDANACKRIVHQLCFVMDRNIKYRPLSDEELGNLRCGLNAIHTKLWRTGRG
ncbi:MAG: hypothetical protein OER56_09540 [Hyphomicrobiales bacterium]|nr:hypothetical protein [Hyphomicrobiales bacterium]